MPKLTKDFFAVPDGEVYPVWFRAGDTVGGSVALAAEQEGILEKPEKPVETRKRKVTTKIETKG